MKYILLLSKKYEYVIKYQTKITRTKKKMSRSSQNKEFERQKLMLNFYRSKGY